MQLPIKDGWWDALLALQNFSRSNKHWSKSCFVKLICYSKIWYFKIKLINIQSSLRSSLCAMTWKFMFYVVLTKLKTHRRLTHHWHVQNSNKNRWQIKITEQLQWHFSNNFIFPIISLFLKWREKSLKELALQYFQRQCWPVRNGFYVILKW